MAGYPNAEEEDLKRQPDAVFIYGVPTESALQVNGNETIFYEDVEMNDRAEACPPFLGGFSSCYGRSFFKPKNRGFEDQIETFLYSF